ncbi:MAG: helix-turn-helix domain-containing protein [gamma proteobacterium symbiont of Bathyaustriella thionipta]|nr:helix-turn-helix domain-containing protein [gamma proteobacterium symbiont of Bathyaustriella thionipta]MCU7950612.1 helix-turn-helix domain-containing protein [gamma proteobacterium symbiont of Bathyaustriella thionipta]MCU7954029.1 helix-turn-helix domain-containing protein [gamma proteobacterium symbiont of Bathyaustriella thionipta]MCU7957053.1 helix-turn-helix domain-containing protein [gamma proteobacterium symbiont of Bathyaustriella thionipta]MCU7967265.1 helix-turn-helix domain-cont
MKSSSSTGSKKQLSSGGQVQSLNRALILMQWLSKASMGLNLSEISGSVGLPVSTVHRLLNSLRQSGFVDYDEQQALWSIGVNAFIVGNAYLNKRDFVSQSRPYMKQLVTLTGETSNMAILEGDSHIFVAQVECSEVMRMVVRLGSRGAVHASGVGKALLSALPEKEVMAIIQRTGLPVLTPKTITSPKAFSNELELIRQRGYAIDDEEQTLGLRCIAANIYDENSEAIGAVSISGPAVRITNERISELSAVLMDIVNQITYSIGGSKP